MIEDEFLLLPYHSHEDSPRHKCHIRKTTSENALCGFWSNYYCSVVIPTTQQPATIINLRWLEGAENNDEFCQHCYKTAFKILKTRAEKIKGKLWKMKHARKMY